MEIFECGEWRVESGEWRFLSVEGGEWSVELRLAGGSESVTGRRRLLQGG